MLADHRDEQATLSFLHAHVAERGHEAETTPFTVNQIRDPAIYEEGGRVWLLYAVKGEGGLGIAELTL